MLRLLGPTRVVGAGGPRLPRAAFLAVALIDFAPGRLMTREALAARLWEGAPSARASTNLRQLVSRIRHWEQASGQSIVVASSEALSRDDETMPSDLTLLLAAGEPQTAGQLRLLSELYGGDFLADIVDAGELAGQWIAEQRTWLRERFVRLALAGAQQVGGPAAEDALRRLAEEAPYDDAVARAAMVNARGDAGRVRAIHDRFAQRLALDLSMAPEPRTSALLTELTGTPATPAGGPDAPRAGVVASLASVPRVLVLPPGAAGAEGDRRLAESLIDEVTHTLGRLRTFAVFSPHTARQLVTQPFPSGNPYGADYLVTTRLVPAAGGTSRLCVSLTRIETHELLLSEELRFAPGDLQAHHFHLAAAVGSRLASGIERTERHLYRVTGSASAYVHFLLGCEDLRGIDLRSVRRAKGHFRQAVKLSPEFVTARAMLARTLCLEWVLLDRNEREPIERAVALAREAASIDPMDPNAHREIGHGLIYLGDIDEAVESLRSATQLGPHRADVLFHYGDGLVHQGEMAEARRVMDQALSLNPLAPDLYYWVSATADYFLGDYASASATLKRMRNREPAARVIAAVEAMNGNVAEAARQRNIYLAAHPDFRLEDYMFPQRRPQDREHYLEGLRRAGFA